MWGAPAGRASVSSREAREAARPTAGAAGSGPGPRSFRRRGYTPQAATPCQAAWLSPMWGAPAGRASVSSREAIEASRPAAGAAGSGPGPRSFRRRGYTPQAATPCQAAWLSPMWGAPAGRAVVAPLRRGGPCGRPRVAGDRGAAITDKPRPCTRFRGESVFEGGREAARPAAGAAGSDHGPRISLICSFKCGARPPGALSSLLCVGAALAAARGWRETGALPSRTSPAPAPAFAESPSSSEAREAARPAAGAAGSDH